MQSAVSTQLSISAQSLQAPEWLDVRHGPCVVMEAQAQLQASLHEQLETLEAFKVKQDSKWSELQTAAGELLENVKMKLNVAEDAQRSEVAPAAGLWALKERLDSDKISRKHTDESTWSGIAGLSSQISQLQVGFTEPSRGIPSGIASAMSAISISGPASSSVAQFVDGSGLVSPYLRGSMPPPVRPIVAVSGAVSRQLSPVLRQTFPVLMRLRWCGSRRQCSRPGSAPHDRRCRRRRAVS